MRLLIALGLLLFTTCAYGESYLVVNKVSQEVVSLSPEKDCVVQPGQEQIILKENYKGH